jgi:hypothetical protein
MIEITKYAANGKPSGSKEFFINDGNDIMLARYSRPLNIDPKVLLFNLKTKTGNITTNANSVKMLETLQSFIEYKRVFGSFVKVQDPTIPGDKPETIPGFYVNKENIATATLAGQIDERGKLKYIYLVTCTDKTTFYTDGAILGNILAPKI